MDTTIKRPTQQDSEPVVPVPKGVRAILSSCSREVSLPSRHPGLQLDKYIMPCPKQEQQKDALAEVVKASGDPALLTELRSRLAAMLKSREAVTWSRTTATPMTVHLARASALENAGICLHPVYGFAYLPGTGLKGMARAYAETEWLAGQPPSARREAWRDIERVFGWAPHSDDLAPGVEKPWKPADAEAHGDDDNAVAGEIVFHDAWPESWPTLVVDIVNNHHNEYYQKDGPPGDWDSPVPVYFLAIPAGRTFSLALSKRRRDVDGRLLGLARQWLDGALTLLGCGAKTTAGYGYFRPTDANTPMALSPDKRRFEVTLELVTPAFLAGADQKDPNTCDLRSATVRGQLRWWWRTMHSGYLATCEIAALEAVIWGDTQASGAVRTLVLPEKRSRVDRYDKQAAGRRCRTTSLGLFYLSYGMDDQVTDKDDGQRKRKQRYVMEPGARWTLQMIARPTHFTVVRGQLPGSEERCAPVALSAEDVLTQARAALWLLCTFGGVGSKERKGFGSLQPTTQSLQDIDISYCVECARRLRAKVALGNKFLADRVTFPSLEQSTAFPSPIATAYHDPWQLIAKIGVACQDYARTLRPKGNRAALGLPRQNLATQILLAKGSKGDRYASPLHLHIRREPSGQLAIGAVAFFLADLPDLITSQAVMEALMDRIEDAVAPASQ